MDSGFKSVKEMANPRWSVVREVINRLLNDGDNSDSRSFAALVVAMNVGRKPLDELQFARCLSGQEVPGFALRLRLVGWCKDQIRDLEFSTHRPMSTCPS